MYCSAADVIGKLGYDFSSIGADSKPTLTQINAEITDITGELNMVLESIGITLPITDANVLNVIEQKCKLGSAGMVGLTYYVNTDAVEGSQADYYYKEYKFFLASIVETPSLVGVSAEASTINVSNQVTDGTTTEKEMGIIGNGFDY